MFDPHKESIAWITKYAEENQDMSYEEIMDAAEGYQETGEVIQGYDQGELYGEDAILFWTHYEKIKGVKVPDKNATPFKCC